MRVIGIASTIDNELYGANTSLGSTTALDIALESIDRLRVTAAAHERAFLVEVMGRNCGYLAAAAAIAGGAEAVVVPEVDTEPQEIESQLCVARRRGKSHAIVVVAEGARHNADILLDYFREHSSRLGYEMRATRLGHIQRGGTPGCFDRLLGSQLGAAAIEKFDAGAHEILLGWRDGAVKSCALADAAGRSPPLDVHMLDLAHTLAL
jgi:6-phosphofructokinase 1